MSKPLARSLTPSTVAAYHIAELIMHACATTGGDDLISPGAAGSFDWGLCYSSPPVVTAEGEAQLFYWGVNGEHCESSRLTLARTQPYG
jgi:hypothetical protein